MAQTKVNPVYVDEEKFFIGLKPTFFEVTFGAAVNAKLDLQVQYRQLYMLF